MQCDVSPAGRYSARNVAGPLPLGATQPSPCREKRIIPSGMGRTHGDADRLPHGRLRHGVTGGPGGSESGQLSWWRWRPGGAVPLEPRRVFGGRDDGDPAEGTQLAHGLITGHDQVGPPGCRRLQHAGEFGQQSRAGHQGHLATQARCRRSGRVDWPQPNPTYGPAGALGRSRQRVPTDPSVGRFRHPARLCSWAEPCIRGYYRPSGSVVH
jgi:hypothetical protein